MTSQNWLYLTNCPTDFDFFLHEKTSNCWPRSYGKFCDTKLTKMQRTMGNFPCRANSGCGPIVHWYSRFSTTRGVFEHLLRLSRLLLVIEKNGKSVRKLAKNDYETISINFSLMSKLWTPGPKWQNFRVFCDCQTSFRKTPKISGTVIARANPKTAFETGLNSTSPGYRQIWHKVNGLASRSPKSKKFFWAKSFTANSFFIVICTIII